MTLFGKKPGNVLVMNAWEAAVSTKFPSQLARQFDAIRERADDKPDARPASEPKENSHCSGSKD